MPKGWVEAQKAGHGSTPCLPHSRMIREEPMRFEMRFPNEDSRIRKLRARPALPEPKTAAKKSAAAAVFDFAISAFGTKFTLVRFEFQI